MALRNHGYAAFRRQLQCAIGWGLLLAAALFSVAQAAEPAPARTAGEAPRTLLVMGDSLSAGYGMAASEGWVALLGEDLAGMRPGWRVVNASISGETSAGGSSRIVGELTRHRPDVVVIALGANDGLRGLPIREMRRNLARMIGASQHVGAEVLLVGMRMPPNLGGDYTRRFEALYRELAEFFGIPLLPFLLEPIARDRQAFQDDNLHPTAEAQGRLRDHVRAALEPLLRADADAPAGTAR
ncbi:arylesterase [Luteimonas sp. RD2P54]|uniref:Arylesterase n=1 Tax=Luteimonas endophytica TaxID=3042023 RepID=A0ABT6JDB5_9GAMM|nr:arylesterase [Luteimonas endophytica]MDH5824820.1 arylesterase [Luteimonas endophytica]